jgi:hypothetical protein
VKYVGATGAKRKVKNEASVARHPTGEGARGSEDQRRHP